MIKRFSANWSLLVLLAALLSKLGQADSIYLPSLKTNATGTTVAGKQALDVNVAAGTVNINEAATSASGGALPALLKVTAGYDGANVQVIKTDVSGNVGVNVQSSALPAGAATALKQDTGNASIASIDAKITAVNTGAVVVSSSALPAGAATEATLSALNGKVTAVNTGAVVISSSALPTGAATAALQAKVPINTTGSGSGAAATVSTVATLTAPANAVGFILMNLDTSTKNMRWAVGRTASATLGQQLQPGRDTGFIPVGADISIIAESGTVDYDVQWVSQ